MKKIILVFLFGIFIIQVFPQPKTNLQVIESLIENSITSIDSLLHKNTKNLYLEFASSSSLSILKSNVMNAFVSHGYVLKSERHENVLLIQYSISNVSVNYSESFKTGFFGDLLSEREIMIEGVYTVQNSNNNLIPHKFNYSVRDTINADEIGNIENKNLDFTKAELPLPNIFSNLLEPIIVVGTLIVTIFLLFIVRSK
jgi:hypothetical protein